MVVTPTLCPQIADVAYCAVTIKIEKCRTFET
jgi:hypothetical protein